MKKSMLVTGICVWLCSFNASAQSPAPQLEAEIKKFSWDLYPEVRDMPVALDRLSVTDSLVLSRVPLLVKVNKFLKDYAQAYYDSRKQSVDALKGALPDTRKYKQLASLGMEDIISNFTLEDSTINPVYALKATSTVEALSSNLATTLFVMLDDIGEEQSRSEKMRLYGAYVFSGLKITTQNLEGDTYRIWADGNWRVLDFTWDIRKNRLTGVHVWTNERK